MTATPVRNYMCPRILVDVFNLNASRVPTDSIASPSTVSLSFDVSEKKNHNHEKELRFDGEIKVNNSQS